MIQLKDNIIHESFRLSDGSYKTLRVPYLGKRSEERDSPEKPAIVAPISDAQYTLSLNADFDCDYGLPKNIKYLTTNELLLFYISAVLSAQLDPSLRIITELYLSDYILKKFAGCNQIMKRFIILKDRLDLKFQEYILSEEDQVTFNGLVSLLKRETNIRVNGRRITLQQYIEDFQIVYHIRKRRKPGKKVRRKGYDDKGSLGSSFSRTIREQSKTEEFQEIVRREMTQRIILEFPEAENNPSLLEWLLGAKVGS